MIFMQKQSRTTTLQRLAAFCLASVFFLPVAAHAQRPAVTSHVPDEVASGIAPLVGHLTGEQHLSLAISLPLRNQAELDDLLQQLYDPQSPNYHKYLSVEEFAERFGPREEDYAAVQDFAKTNGLDVIDTPANRMVLDVEGAPATIESAFHVTLGVYQHPTEARTFYAPDREPTVDIDCTSQDWITFRFRRRRASSRRVRRSRTSKGRAPADRTWVATCARLITARVRSTGLARPWQSSLSRAMR
jgi:hypothetical protein